MTALLVLYDLKIGCLFTSEQNTELLLSFDCVQGFAKFRVFRLESEAIAQVFLVRTHGLVRLHSPEPLVLS